MTNPPMVEERMFRLLLDILGGLKKMAADFTHLNAAVAANTTAVNSLIAEVEKLNTPDTTTQPAIDAATAAVTASNAAIATELAKFAPTGTTGPAGS